MVNLNDMAEQAYMLAKQRGLDIRVVPTLKHCAGEVVEATEAFTRVEEADSYFKVDKRKPDLCQELADIIICVLTASYEAKIDIEKALKEAMIKNAGRAYKESQGGNPDVRKGA